jgi:paraquat-inducible protein B
LPPDRASTRRREWLPSLIWLIPIVAALVGITLVARILMERGPEVVLTFKTAEGLEAGKTAVKYKDVQIGLVTHLRLARDRSHVRVLVQFNKDAEGFTATDSRFWVVRPRLDTSGISGLNTLLSGAYIGADAGTVEGNAGEFTGLETPPIVTRDDSGKQFLLRANDVGSLDVGSPVYYRRVKVGQVAAYELDGDGRGVTLRVFVNAPYDKFVGMNTPLLAGQRHRRATERQRLHAAHAVAGHHPARRHRLPGARRRDGPGGQGKRVVHAHAGRGHGHEEPDGPSQTLLMYFNQSLRGLAPGAPVDFRGVVIGEVKSIGVEFDRAEREFRMPVLVQVYPDRLRRREAAGAEQPETRATQQERLRFLVREGPARPAAQRQPADRPGVRGARLLPEGAGRQGGRDQNPIELATVPNSLDEIQSQVQEIATKLNKVPYEQIANDLRTTLATLNKTLTAAEQTVKRINSDVTPELAAAMKDVRKTVNTAERTLADDSPLQQDMRQTLQELTRAAGSVRVLTDYLERHPESLLRGKPDDKK